jgi:hypothetical protein
MTWKIYLIEDSQAVRTQCADGNSLDDLTMLAIETCFTAVNHNCRSILIDISEATMTFPTKDFARLADLYAEYRLPKTIRTALVLGTKEWPENFAKVVTAAKEYGYTIDLLLGEKQVKEWLSA